MFHAEQYYKTQNFSFIFSVVQKLDMVYDFIYLLGRIAMIFLSAVDGKMHKIDVPLFLDYNIIYPTTLSHISYLSKGQKNTS